MPSIIKRHAAKMKCALPQRKRTLKKSPILKRKTHMLIVASLQNLGKHKEYANVCAPIYFPAVPII